ncbi:MAG: hypothetical protein PHC69_05840 [Ruminiclostridium sp.]|nr:hypothetical protein [Ruminiclostridium sp.]
MHGVFLFTSTRRVQAPSRRRDLRVQPVDVGDYFDDNLQCGNVAYKDRFPSEKQKDFPDCLLRFWTMGEIISNIASVGFVIERLVEGSR